MRISKQVFSGLLLTLSFLSLSVEGRATEPSCEGWFLHLQEYGVYLIENPKKRSAHFKHIDIPNSTKTLVYRKDKGWIHEVASDGSKFEIHNGGYKYVMEFKDGECSNTYSYLPRKVLGKPDIAFAYDWKLCNQILNKVGKKMKKAESFRSNADKVELSKNFQDFARIGELEEREKVYRNAYLSHQPSLLRNLELSIRSYRDRHGYEKKSPKENLGLKLYKTCKEQSDYAIGNDERYLKTGGEKSSKSEGAK